MLFGWQILLEMMLIFTAMKRVVKSLPRFTFCVSKCENLRDNSTIALRITLPQFQMHDPQSPMRKRLIISVVLPSQFTAQMNFRRRSNMSTMITAPSLPKHWQIDWPNHFPNICTNG